MRKFTSTFAAIGGSLQAPNKTTGIVASLSGDSHSLSDFKYDTGTVNNPTYEGMKSMYTQLSALYPNLTFGILVGDFFGAQGTHTFDDVTAHLSGVSHFVGGWDWNKFFLFPGNHDGNNPQDIINGYFRDYVDPTGVNTATSGRDASKFPFKTYEDDADYYSRAIIKDTSNVQLINLPDRNDVAFPAGKGDGSELGGFPAGAASLDHWAKMVYSVLANPDLNTITTHHHSPKDTVANTYDWCDKQDGFNHRWQENGSPIGRGRWQFFIDLDNDKYYQAEDIHHRFYSGGQSNLFLHLSGHVHIAYNALGVSPKQEIRSTKWGIEFLNVCSISQWHSTSPVLGESKSWMMLIDDAATDVNLKAYVHRDDNNIGLNAGDEITTASFNLGLPHTYEEYHKRQTAETPNTIVSGLAISDNTTSTLQIDWNALSGADGYMLVRSESPISWTPTDNTPYYPSQEVAPGVFISMMGENNSFEDFKLSENTTYYYVVYPYGAGNDEMLYNVTTPTSVSGSTLAYTALNQTTLESPEIAIDALDESSKTLNDELVSSISNLGSSGGSFVQSVDISKPWNHIDGILAGGTNWMKLNTPFTIDGLTELYIVNIYKGSELNHTREFAKVLTTDMHLFSINDTVKEFSTSSNREVSLESNSGTHTDSAGRYDLDDGFVYEEIILENDELTVKINGVVLSNRAVSGGINLNETGANYTLFSDETEDVNKCFAGYLKGHFVWKTMPTDKAAIKTYLDSFY